MSKHKWISVAVLVAGVAVFSFAAAFTDLASPQYYGKASQEKAYTAIDANFAKIEGGLVTKTPTALSVTNGQVLTVAQGYYLIQGIGGGNDTTNTITLANPTTVGDSVLFMVAPGTTNRLAITNGINITLNTNVNSIFYGNEYDNITLFGASTNWVELYRMYN